PASRPLRPSGAADWPLALSITSDRFFFLPSRSGSPRRVSEGSADPAASPHRDADLWLISTAVFGLSSTLQTPDDPHGRVTVQLKCQPVEERREIGVMSLLCVRVKKAKLQGPPVTVERQPSRSRKLTQVGSSVSPCYKHQCNEPSSFLLGVLSGGSEL
ncbi:hypothetical protein AOLI_G00274490, partial [Acnodon oligacanthus]